MKNVGFIGLGDMGFPIAKNLVGKDFKVVVFNKRPEPMAAFSKLGVTGVKSNREVGQLCDMIGICVRTMHRLKR